ncbi:hypothetical protein OB13_00440 [Pontibacter sp. HJ8]
MRELVAIVVSERKSLLRGFLVAFMLVFPFTFLPTIFRNGFSWHFLQQRLPQSILYAALFAVAIILFALLNNYEKLLHKKRLYNFPAFTALDFYGGIEGYNSILRELSTYLIGKMGNYYYKVDIINPELQNFKIEVAPMIQICPDSSMFDRLTCELQLKENLYLSRVLSFSEEQLQEEDTLRNELLKLSDELTSLGVTPSKVDVTSF